MLFPPVTMKIHTKKLSALAATTDTYDALVAGLGAPPDLLFIHCATACDLEAIGVDMLGHAPQVPVHGGTSCRGVMTETGVDLQGGGAIMGISDPQGRYGVGAAIIGEDPRGAVRRAIHEALEKADSPGEVPALVWMTAAPGHEESLISEIAAVLGDGVPVAGGSSADDDVSGNWQQLANGRTYSDAVVVTVLFPSTEIMFAFHSGYEPTSVRGEATLAQGRHLLEIDDRPAARVYNEWIEGEISDVIETGGSILQRATLHPLGRVVGHVGVVPYYQLSHPNAVTADGTLTFFTEISPGDELVLMRGTIDSIVSRAARVATSGLETYTSQPENVAGALVIYCAGCMLAAQGRVEEVVEDLRAALPDTPFLGAFTFGEQGCFGGGENRHGNLMISVLLFSK